MKKLMVIITMTMTMPIFAQNQQLPLTIEDARMDRYLKQRKAPQLAVKVVNSTKPLEGVKVKYSTVHLGAEMQTKNLTQLNAKGEALIELTENLPYQQVWLDVDGFFYTGVVVNERLEVVIDAEKINKQAYIYSDDILFKGADAGVNTALCKQVLYKKNIQEKLSHRMVDISIDAANKKLAPDVFVKTADSIYAAMRQIDDDFLKENAGYEWAIRNETSSSFYEWAVVGLKGNNSVTEGLYKDVFAHKPYFMSNSGAGFYRSLSSYLVNKKRGKETDIQKSLYASKTEWSPEQKVILDSIAYYLGLPGEKEEKILQKLYTKRYNLFKKEIDLIYFKNALAAIESNTGGSAADILKLSLMEGWKDDFSTIYPILSNGMKTEWTRKFVQRELSESLAKQKEVEKLFQEADKLTTGDFYIGKPVASLPFGAQLYTLDSISNIDDFIVNLKSKFKNKALIIDIWATWCVPCVSDITNSKSLHEDSKGLPIEYIYLCTTSGSDIETWKKRVATLKPFGTHIFINEELEAAFRKKLNAGGGYPTYIVMDRKGNSDSKRISFMSSVTQEQLQEIAEVE